MILISTDKAVEPVSVYGVSKMLCEKLVNEAASNTKEGQDFMFVRFGNVLGSRGSILPVFMAFVIALTKLSCPIKSALTIKAL